MFYTLFLTTNTLHQAIHRKIVYRISLKKTLIRILPATPIIPAIIIPRPWKEIIPADLFWGNTLFGFKSTYLKIVYRNYNYTADRNACPGWPVYEVKCLCSRVKSLTLLRTKLAMRFLKRSYQNSHSLQVWSLSVTLPSFAEQKSKWWFLNISLLIGHIY